jgi:hypothetical protein
LLPELLLLEDLHGIQVTIAFLLHEQHLAVRTSPDDLNEGKVILGDFPALSLSLGDEALVFLSCFLFLDLKSLIILITLNLTICRWQR